MANYAKSVPRDIGGATLDGYPAPYVSSVGQLRQRTDNATVSSVINLNPTTQTIEIASFGGQGAVIRWIPTTETAAVSPFASVISSGLTANFHHHIQPNTVRSFVIPKETQGQMAGGQVGSVNGLYQRLAWASAGATASSIVSVEF